jgi:K+-transporting ATPase ATPase C chain
MRDEIKTDQPPQPPVSQQPPEDRGPRTRAGPFVLQTRRALVVLIALSVLVGIVYPLFITGIGAAFFRQNSTGSLVVENGQVVGSELIGQPFDDPRYFWSRPSATSPFPYNAAASTGSNLGPTNPDLLKAIADRIASLRAADPGNAAPIPIDLVTASGSGLDPDISPAAAEYQVARIARARAMPVDDVRGLVQKYTRGRQLGFLGEPRVNVLELNLALDSLHK